jgi:hypothetical protein
MAVPPVPDAPPVATQGRCWAPQLIEAAESAVPCGEERSAASRSRMGSKVVRVRIAGSGSLAPVLARSGGRVADVDFAVEPAKDSAVPPSEEAGPADSGRDLLPWVA